MSGADRPLGLGPTQVEVLRRLWSWRQSPQGPWSELNLSDQKPLPPSYVDLIARGWIKSGRGRCGPLGLYIGTWVVALTDEGAAIARLLGCDADAAAPAP